MDENRNSETNVWYKFIIKELERINKNQEEINNQIYKLYNDVAKLSELKHSLKDLKDHKEGIDRVITTEDMKKTKDLIEDFKTFKSRVTTAAWIIGGILSILLTVMGWFIA